MEAPLRSAWAIAYGAIVGLVLNVVLLALVLSLLMFVFGVGQAGVMAHPVVVPSMFVLGAASDLAAGWMAGRVAGRAELAHAAAAGALIMAGGLSLTLATQGAPTLQGVAGLAMTVPFTLAGGALARQASRPRPAA